MYFTMQQCADNLAVDVVCAVSAVFRSPLRHVEMSAMIHQMNRLGVARRVDDPEGLRRGRPVAPLPRRGTDAGGSWSAIWSRDRAPDNRSRDDEVAQLGKPRQVPRLDAVGNHVARRALVEYAGMSDIADAAWVLRSAWPAAAGTARERVPQRHEHQDLNLGCGRRRGGLSSHARRGPISLAIGSIWRVSARFWRSANACRFSSAIGGSTCPTSPPG
jgi:hypothetical protein